MIVAFFLFFFLFFLVVFHREYTHTGMNKHTLNQIIIPVKHFFEKR